MPAFLVAAAVFTVGLVVAVAGVRLARELGYLD